MEQFSITKYLIDNGLAKDDGQHDVALIPSTWEISEVAHKVFSSHSSDRTAIILCSLIAMFAGRRPEELKKLQFSLIENDYGWSIWFSWKDQSSYHGLDWRLTVSAIENLMPYMAGSNISYLAGQVLNDL